MNQINKLHQLIQQFSLIKKISKPCCLILIFILSCLNASSQILNIAANVTVTESAGAAVFTVTLAPTSAGTVTVNYATANFNAVAPSDYTATSGTLTFLTGESSKTISVPIINDYLNEINESFTINISSPVGATISVGSRSCTITNDDPILNILTPAAVAEEVGSQVFTVTMSSAQTYSVSVHYEASNYNAIVGVDFANTVGDLIFAPGEISKTITVPIIIDYLNEGNEIYQVTISNAQNVNAIMPMTIITNVANGTINNDDPILNILTPAAVAEDVGSQVFTVTLSLAQTYSVSVHYVASTYNAIVGVDFVNTVGDLIFAPGEISKTITVPIIVDYQNEANEIYQVTISNAQNLNAVLPMSINTNVANGTINNDDPILNILTPAAVAEEIGSQTFTVTLSSAQTYSVTVHYAASTYNAIVGVDFVNTVGDLIFAPGEVSKTITVPIIIDYLNEANEIYQVTISNAQNVNAALPMSINTSVVNGTINNDDPILNILTPAAVAEDVGSQVFTVTLSSAQTYSVSVHYAASTYNAIVGVDFVNTMGDLIFAPGEISKTITVPIIIDYLNEANEIYQVTISNPQNVNAALPMSISASVANGTINNDDPILNILTPAAVTEDIGSQTFTVTLSVAASYTISVNYATSTYNAISDVDFVNTSGILVFNPGEISKTITVPIIIDYLNESNEIYQMTISNALNVNASFPMSINTNVANGGINNDDPLLNILTPAAVAEDFGSQTFTVTLSSAQTYSVSVHYAAVTYNAIAGIDFVNTVGDLIFAPGEISKTITVPFIIDYLNEGNEIYQMIISNAQNANAALPMSISTSVVNGTINNDDPVINILTPANVTENAGVQIFTVTVSSPQSYPIAVDYIANNYSATLGNDFTFSNCSLTLNFAPGETSKIFSVSIIDDGVAESSEIYQAAISNARNANVNLPMSITIGTVNGTITDNDNASCGTNVLSKPVISGTTLYCPNTNLFLSVAPVAGAIGYKWSGPNSFTSLGTSITINNVTATQSGVYTVRAYRTGGTVCDTSVGANVNVSVVPCASTVSVKAYIEGYYVDSGRMTTALLNHGLSPSTTICDSIDIELHHTISPYALVASVRTALFTNGTAIATYPAITGTYYLALKHQSALQTWSSNPVVISVTPVAYDFTNASSKAFGNNMKEVEPGIWAIFSGEIVHDDNIDLLDYPEMESRINAFDTCYLTTDLNGDGNTDLLDASLLENNINNFIFATIP